MRENPHLLNACGNCRFYRDNDCRRFPPQWVMYRSNSCDPATYDSTPLYPAVDETVPCCGEFKPFDQEPLVVKR